MRVSPPPLDNLFWNSSMIGSQLLLSLYLAPSGTPKYLMGNCETLQPKTCDNKTCDNCWPEVLPPHTTNSDLFKLIFGLETAWKQRRIHLKSKRDCSLGWQKIKMSSANSRWVISMWLPFFPIVIPSSSSRFFPFSMNFRKCWFLLWFYYKWFCNSLLVFNCVMILIFQGQGSL